MYLYFDKNGALKEIINNDAIRKGNNNANKVYCYFEDEPSFDYLTAIIKLPDRTLTNEIFFEDDIVEEAVPYNAKIDYKYFKDFVKYKFYVLNLNFVLNQSGLYLMTIRAFIDDSIFAKGEITFNAEQNVINSDNNITQSQYDYLLSIVNEGVTFIPSVSEDGFISWTNTGNLPNPEPVSVRGGRGYSISQVRQIQTSQVSEGVNIVEFILENGNSVGEIRIKNGSKGEKGENATNATYFEIDDNGHLIMFYSTNGSSPDIYLVSDDKNSDSYYETLGVHASLVGHLVFIYS